jgi:DivIVA domain-containing protein
MDQRQLERIRNPDFPLVRRGYEPREVDNFLLALADWLENGGLDEAGSYAVTRRLERAGETTTRLLAAAQAEADQIIKDAEADAQRTIIDAQDAARRKIEQTRAQARELVEEAEAKRVAINEEIAELQDAQRRVVAELARLRDVLGTALAGPPAEPTEVPPAIEVGQ